MSVVASDARDQGGPGPDGAGTPVPPFAALPTELRRRALLVVVVGIVLVVALVRLVLRDPEPRPIGIEIRNPTTLVLLTSCARDVSARLAESAGAVRIDQVAGRVIDGDCTGGVDLGLSAPLGDRLVFVAGEQWTEVGASCPYGGLGPDGGIDLPPECR